MSTLTLSLKYSGSESIDASALCPSALCGASRDAIARTPVIVGNQERSLDAVFDIDGELAKETDQLIINNSHQKLTHVGAFMKSGRLLVIGDVGRLTGRSMRAGELIVEGSVGDYTGSGMRGGSIYVTGNAGHFTGGAFPGERYGMRGGSLVVEGGVGDRLGDRLRRGTLVVGGNAGAMVASRVVAGTIAVAGEIGDQPAFGMRRGTLILASHMGAMNAGTTPDGFVESAPAGVAFVNVLMKSVERLIRTDVFPTSSRTSPLERLVGDRRVDGKAEILFLGIETISRTAISGVS